MRRRIFKLGLICLIIAAAVCLAARFLVPAWLGYPTYASVETICPGDVNHDEQRDIRDVVAIQAHILGKTTLAGELLVVADVNQDSKIDVLDVVRLIQHITRRKLLVDCKGTMSVSPGSLDFGEVRAGTSKDLTIAVRNAGNAKLTITSMTSNSAQFATASPATPFDVLPGTEREVAVRFSPASVASYSATLTISGTSGGTAMNAVVSLAGAGLTATNPSPTLSSLSPASATAGDPGFNLVLAGTNFMAGSQVFWDGSARATTFVSAAEVRAAIPTSDLAQADVVGVSVTNPAPGGGESAVKLFTINPRAQIPAGGPRIRYLAPVRGLAGGKFTLQGTGFAPSTGANRVSFFVPGSEVQATLVSASETTIVGTVPATLSAKVYGVTVTVNQKTSNAVSYQVTTTPAGLTIYPSNSVLLLPPGSGKEYLVLGGGTPPYKLRPLAAEYQTAASAELKGNVVEVTGLDSGPNAKDVRIEVEDSAATPSVVSSTVRVQRPSFDPGFDISWPTLLAGSSPGFRIRVSTTTGEMRLRTLRIKLHGLAEDLSTVSEGYVLALAQQEDDYHILEVTSKSSSTALSYEGIRRTDTSIETIAEGEIQTLPSGWPVITLRDYPAPVAEAVNRSGSNYQILCRDQLFRLPTAANQDFTVTAAFTSVTVLEGKELPMVKTVTKTFRTTGLASGAPAITRLVPTQAEIGRPVEVIGSGFDPVAANNHVTFTTADGKTVEARLVSTSAGKLVAYVPQSASTGPVRVTVGASQSNEYVFTVLFRPFATVFFESLTANTLQSPQLLLGQPYDVAEFGSLKLVLDRGRLDVSQLVKGQQAGSVDLYSGVGSQLVLVFGGQEPDGLHRHFFEMKETLQDTDVIAKVYVFDNAGGEGVTLEGALEESLDVSGGSCQVNFQKPFYKTPAAGTTVGITMTVRSAPWCFLPGTELEVVFGQRMKTQ